MSRSLFAAARTVSAVCMLALAAGLGSSRNQCRPVRHLQELGSHGVGIGSKRGNSRHVGRLA